jgi:hypothetical protein
MEYKEVNFQSLSRKPCRLPTATTPRMIEQRLKLSGQRRTKEQLQIVANRLVNYIGGKGGSGKAKQL